MRENLVDVGTRLLVDELSAGLGMPQPQSGNPTYASKLRAEEFQIDWARTSAEIDRLIRLGGAWTTLHDRRLRILEAELIDAGATSSDELRGDRIAGLRIVTVQPEGKAPMPFEAFARGARLAAAQHLGVVGAGSVNDR